MEVHSDYVESSKSALSYENVNYYRAEDSGYHTSFTPGSFEHSHTDLSSDFFEQSLPPRSSYYDVTPELNIRLSRRYGPLKQRNDISTDTPPPRRGIKRPHPSAEVAKQITSIPTPTTLIAGKIESLEVNEDKENTTVCIPQESPLSTKSSTRYIYRLKIPEQILPYPITPVKRNCRLSPCKSAKKLDFADFSIHSLSCKQHELLPVPEEIPKLQVIQPSLARPNQKIDILSLLHDTCAIPALKSIFQFLSNEDSHNFCLVSDSWNQIWNLYSSKEKKQEKRDYLKTVKENQENCAKNNLPHIKNRKLHGSSYLREIHNDINDNPVNSALISPPHSPKSNRFRKFTKSASLDSRLQLSCVRCSQPAKVTEEQTGEEWVECTSATCSYQFCRSCSCSRHPGKTCFQYDLNAPSPSKRKKCEYAVGTMKSRKNLRRLL